MLTWYGENSSLFDSPDLRFATVAVISPDVFVDSVDLSEAINAIMKTTPMPGRNRKSG